MAHLPRWVSFMLGVVAVVVGVLLLTRPLTSLAALAVYLGVALLVLGGTTLLADRAGRTMWGPARAGAWIALGILVLVWLRHSFDLLALAVGLALVGSGGARLWSAARGPRAGGVATTGTDRLAGGLLGLAEIIIGVLAVRWPDLTLLAVAVIFAARLIFLGLRLVRGAWSGRAGPTAYSSKPRAAPPGCAWSAARSP